MKIWILMLSLFLSCTALIVWDSLHTQRVFNAMDDKCSSIYYSLLSQEITEPDIQAEIYDLNDYWTKKMDTLCVSISRKDLQTVSDYLQYLYASIHNKNQEDAVTYSRLLYYNILGLKELTGITMLNLL